MQRQISRAGRWQRLFAKNENDQFSVEAPARVDMTIGNFALDNHNTSGTQPECPFSLGASSQCMAWSSSSELRSVSCKDAGLSGGEGWYGNPMLLSEL